MTSEAPQLDPVDVAERVARQLRPLYTVETLAEYLALSKRTVHQLLADGAIPSFKVGGARRIDPAAVDEYLAARRVQTTTEGSNAGCDDRG